LLLALKIGNPALPGPDFHGTCVRAGEFLHRHGTHPAFHGADVFGRIFQGLGVSSFCTLWGHAGPRSLQEWKKTFFSCVVIIGKEESTLVYK
jgi:hypothetical protein